MSGHFVFEVRAVHSNVNNASKPNPDKCGSLPISLFSNQMKLTAVEDGFSGCDLSIFEDLE